jgi:NADH-quinone oxidoreductase subunit H
MDLFEWVSLGVKVTVIVGGVMTVVAIMTWVERRGSALMQDRLGPNRVGPFGLLQPVADGIKFMWKEDPVPAHVEKLYYLLAPLICLVTAVMSFAVVPLAAPITVSGRVIHFQIADLNVGVLYVFAVASLGIFGIVMAGWASNNKYSLLGAIRSVSQMISYELAMGLAIIGVVMAFGSLELSEIARGQGETLLHIGPFSVPKWGIFFQPIGFLVFLTSVFAETNRLPFDHPEGEAEIVAGYHLEYGSMKFATFFLAEYLNMITASALIAILYFGGWQLLPGLDRLHDFVSTYGGLQQVFSDVFRAALQAGSLFVKIGFFLWFFVWVRWTLPRFRYDQLMALGWKVLFPLSLLNIAITAGLMMTGVV